MGSKWGGYSGYVRLGVNWNRVSQTATHETWKVTAVLGKNSGTWDHMGNKKWYISGAMSTSGNLYISTGSTYVTLGSAQATFARQYGKAQTKTVTVSCNGASIYYPPSVSASFTIAARPYEKPSKPTNVSATYVTDSQIRVQATITASTAKPVSTVYVSRAEDGSSTFIDVATVQTGAGEFTWTDRYTYAGHYYKYRVSAKGAGGGGDYAQTNIVYTSQNAPLDVKATKTSDNNIKVTWTNNGVGSYQTGVFEVLDDEGTRFQLLENLTGGVSEYIVSSPSTTVPHRYAVMHYTGERESGKVLSNTVQLASAPYQPLIESPIGGTYISTEQKTYTVIWRHRSSDTSAQSKAELQYVQATTSGIHDWGNAHTVTVNGTENTYTANPLGSGTAVCWRVRTWGQDANKPSVWSDTTRVLFEQPPTVTIESPKKGETIDRANATIAVSSPNAEMWEITVTPQPGVCGDAHGRYRGSFSGGEAFLDLGGLQNNQTYTVSCRGIVHVYSDPVEITFKIEYAAPPLPVLKVDRIQDPTDREYQNNLSISFASEEVGGETGATSVRVDRVLPDNTFELVQDNIIPNSGVITDYIPHPTGETLYYVMVTNSLGQTALTSIEAKPRPPQQGIMLAYKESKRAVILYNPQISANRGLEYAQTYHMLGATMPTLVAGRHESNSVNVSGILVVEDLEKNSNCMYGVWDRYAHLPEPVLYSDPAGRRMWGKVSNLQMRHDREHGLIEVSYTVTQVRPPAYVQHRDTY